MKKLAYLSLALVLAFTIVSCGKYEEGPALSLRSKKARVANEWIMTSWTIDGSTTTFTKEEALAFSGSTEFTKDGKVTYKDETGTADDVQDTWEFNSDKTGIIFIDSEDGEKDEWEIVKLKEKEFWVKQTTTEGGESSTVEIQMVPNE